MSFKIVPIPSIGAVASRPRKEGIYDTEGYVGGTAVPTQTLTFNNFSLFATAGLQLAKAFGRDCNLTGGQGGLPAAHHHYWYSWRSKIRTLIANLGTAANVVVSEQINRMRELSFAQFNYATSQYITLQFDELPNGVGPAFVNTTFAGATVFSLPSGTPSRNNGKDVTVSGRPQEIVALEGFRIVTSTPANTSALGVTMIPIVDFYVTHYLDGLLLRGITG